MDFFFGEVKTPTLENSEDFWAYRSVEKSILDIQGLTPSSDFGLEAKGFADPGQHVGDSAMVGDGTGQKPDTDRFKKWYLSVPVRFGDLRVEPALEYQSVRVDLAKVRAHRDSLGLNNDQAPYKVFAAYELRRAAVGVEVYTRVNHKVPSTKATEPRGISVFARGTGPASVTPPYHDLQARVTFYYRYSRP